MPKGDGNMKEPTVREMLAQSKRASTGRIDSCAVIQVIEVKFLRGQGIEGDVCRIVTAYYSLDGRLLAEVDPCPQKPAS